MARHLPRRWTRAPTAASTAIGWPPPDRWVPSLGKADWSLLKTSRNCQPVSESDQARNTTKPKATTPTVIRATQGPAHQPILPAGYVALVESFGFGIMGRSLSVGRPSKGEGDGSSSATANPAWMTRRSRVTARGYANKPRVGGQGASPCQFMVKSAGKPRKPHHNTRQADSATPPIYTHAATVPRPSRRSVNREVAPNGSYGLKPVPKSRRSAVDQL